jgi:transcriptional regulator with XRE-family HTH domain
MSSAITSFADFLRQRRTFAALSEEVLAKRAGLSLLGVSDLERGAQRGLKRRCCDSAWFGVLHRTAIAPATASPVRRLQEVGRGSPRRDRVLHVPKPSESVRTGRRPQ